MENTNIFTWGTAKVPMQGPGRLPLTSTDYIASEITVDEDGDYSEYVSLTTKLQEITQSIEELQKKINGINDTTDTIDTLPEIVSFLKDYSNKETLKDVTSVETESTTDDSYNDVF